jgi:hypothetical protein
MVAITATTSATPSLQASLLAGQRDSALRDAAKAEATAKSLREQADEQDRLASQARQKSRADADNTSASSATSNTPSTAKVPLTSVPKTLGQSGASYVETLSNVLQLGKPLTNADYTYAAQKNIVLASLFQAANNIWTADAPPTPPVLHYNSLSGQTANPSTGSILNTVA